METLRQALLAQEKGIKKSFVARWIASDEFSVGTVGVCWPADGYYDPMSTEYEAFCFDAQDGLGAAYCSREDFEVVQD